MFQLSEKENKRIAEFIKEKRIEYTGAIGGQFTWGFTPTTIGTIVSITDNVSKETLDVTDYDEW